jgi:hypothetical protein
MEKKQRDCLRSYIAWSERKGNVKSPTEDHPIFAMI